MKVFDHLIEQKNISLALGFFDGVHLGHQTVIKSAVESGEKSAVITFKRHPLELFSDNKIEYITTNEKRRELIEQLGVDYIFELDFNNEIASMTGQEYLENILIKFFSPISISTGFNHTFGKNKSGNTELLSKYSEIHKYKYNLIPSQKLNNEIISSSKIKTLISTGDIETANKMLGYNFSISETVVKGNQIGRTIGFPTANINYPDNIIKIPYGVYSTRVLGNKMSMTNYGVKPTLNGITPIVESHILNFNEDLYNKDIEVEFIKKIRAEKKFNSLEDLKAQINKDIQEC